LVLRLLSLAVLVFVVAGCGGSSSSLPYDKVTFKASDARRAFAGQRIDLAVKSRGPSVTSLGDRRDILEVDVFGDPSALEREGFHDLPGGRDCSVAGHLALHWHRNVRAILNCDLVRNDARWLARMNRALTALG
jgi:hypothetical protein